MFEQFYVAFQLIDTLDKVVVFADFGFQLLDAVDDKAVGGEDAGNGAEGGAQKGDKGDDDGVVHGAIPPLVEDLVQTVAEDFYDGSGEDENNVGGVSVVVEGVIIGVIRISGRGVLKDEEFGHDVSDAGVGHDMGPVGGFADDIDGGADGKLFQIRMVGVRGGTEFDGVAVFGCDSGVHEQIISFVCGSGKTGQAGGVCPAGEGGITADGGGGHVGDLQRGDTGDNAHMVVVQLVGIAGVGGGKGPVRVPGVEGAEDKIAGGKIGNVGHGAQVCDRLTGSPVGSVGAGPEDAAVAESANDETDAVTIAVGAGMAFTVCGADICDLLDGREKVGDGHDGGTPYDIGVAETLMLGRRTEARSPGPMAILMEEEVSEVLTARDEMAKVG